MKLTGGGNHHAAGGKHERDKEASREIEDCQATEATVPAFAEHRVGQQERHVDADRRRRCGDHPLALRRQDGLRPVVRVAGRGDEGLQVGRRSPKEANVRREARENPAPVEDALQRHGRHHTEETDHHQAHHRLERPVEDPHPHSGRVVEPDNHRGHEKQPQHTEELPRFTPERLGKKILLQGRRPQRELRHGPHKVGHQRREQPAPAEHRADMGRNRVKGPLSG